MITDLHPRFPSNQIRFSKAIAVLLAFIALAAPVFAGILNSQEQQIADDMINDSHQGRPSLTLDPILAGVARARATDMARRDYFGHVNPDGVAANYLVRHAGYQLPAWWDADPKANYIESIAAGYATPQTTWTGWMNSPDHRTHILGLNSFYASETSYGIGYYYDANSTYKHYWVVITAPPQPAPLLAITSPAGGARVTTPAVAITGTASASSAAATVVYRVENAGVLGAFQKASGVASWSASATGLAPGENTIRVRSLNANGGTVAEATRVVTYVEMGSLTVLVNGNGTVTAGYAGTTEREIDRKYTITAVPAAGFLFAGWSGDSTAKTPALTFTMADGLSFQANFVENSFIDLRGNYAGLASSAAHPGFVRIALTTNGVFTGRLAIDGLGYSFAGRFDTNGSATISVPRKNSTPLTLALQLDLNGASEKITGTVSDGTFSADISADHATFDGLADRAPQAGHYTVVLAAQANTDGAAVPQGSGFASLAVATNGTARIAGRLADNTAFSQTSMVSKEGVLPLFLSLVRTKGSVAGNVTFRSTNVSDLDGAVTWIKTARTTDATYPDGFTTQLSVVGSSYVAPAANVRALAFSDAPGNGSVSLGDGNMANPLDVAVTLATNNRVAMAAPSAPDFAGSITRANGVVTGSFTHPSGKRIARGVVLQKQNAAFGFFLGVDQSGYFSLGAN